MAISTLTAGANGLAAFVGDITYKGSLARRRRSGEARRRNSPGWRRSRPTERGSTATISSACGGHVRPRRRFRGRQFDARPEDARRHDRAACVGRGDPDRAGRDQHRRARSADREQLQCLGQDPRRQLPRRRRGADHRRRHQGPERRARAHFRRQRRDLLLAELTAAHRRDNRDGRRRPSERTSDARPAAPRRAAERRRRPRALYRAAASGWRWRRSASVRGLADRPRSARSRCSTGPSPNGRVRALRLPIEGRLGPGGGFAIGTACAVVSFNYLQMSTLQLGPTRLPVCPIGPAMVYKREGRAGDRERPPQRSGARGPARQLPAASCRLERTGHGQRFRLQQPGASAGPSRVADPVRCGSAERQLRRLEPARQASPAARARSARFRC